MAPPIGGAFFRNGDEAVLRKRPDTA